jgi:hypothetical protein
MDSFLNSYTRQAKLYIDLPSGGKFYDDSVIAESQFVHLPVYGMTAADEIKLKTPDSLFSGLATAEIIKSCVPAIIDPNKLVRYDIEYILLAIKIASEGDKLDLESNCPKCNHENGLEINLSVMLSSYDNLPVDHSFTVDNLTFHLSPITYKLVTDVGLESYILQRQLFQINQDVNMSDDEKQKAINKIVIDITKLNNKAIVSYISKISDQDNNETNPSIISNFIENNEVAFTKKILKEVRDFTVKWQMPSINITCQNAECKNEYQSSMNLDYTSFFGKLSSNSVTLT